jgi:hypothetical protein
VDDDGAVGGEGLVEHVGAREADVDQAGTKSDRGAA